MPRLLKRPDNRNGRKAFILPHIPNRDIYRHSIKVMRPALTRGKTGQYGLAVPAADSRSGFFHYLPARGKRSTVRKLMCHLSHGVVLLFAGPAPVR